MRCASAAAAAHRWYATRAHRRRSRRSGRRQRPAWRASWPPRGRAARASQTELPPPLLRVLAERHRVALWARLAEFRGRLLARRNRADADILGVEELEPVGER